MVQSVRFICMSQGVVEFLYASTILKPMLECIVQSSLSSAGFFKEHRFELVYNWINEPF